MNKQKILETQISTFKKIEISNLPKKIPDFKNSFDSKDNIIKKWFINWIDTILKSNNEKEHLLLPSKQILAKHLNVSVGTIQSAIRYIEDLGYVESKQKIGTIIKTSKKSVFKKLTSKRDLTINHIRQYIIEHNFKKDQILPDLNFVIKTLNISSNTLRLALAFMVENNELKQIKSNINIHYRVLNILNPIDYKTNESITLVDKIAFEIKEYIKSNFKTGDKLPSNNELAKIFNASIKTINDVCHILEKQNIICSKRGKYGTIVTFNENMQNKNNVSKLEDKIFTSSQNAQFYYYQKIETNILKMIQNQYSLGDKLPTIQELSQHYDVSTNTVRKALNNLNKKGIVQFLRGRYGGTFVSSILDETYYEYNSIQKDGEAYKWLSLNPKYFDDYMTNNQQ